MPRSVLIVDDERETNDLLASLVRTRGYEPIQLYGGEGVVETVREYQPELILLDLMLPDIDGFTLCEQLKTDRATNLIPIIMVTALNGARHYTKGIRVGANEYISKPFIPEHLFEVMDRTLAWRREHEQRGTRGEIRFDIRSDFKHLQQLNDMLADLFAHTPLTERQIKDLRQAVHEMGGNAIEWGNKKNADLPLVVTYRIDSDSVVLVIKDQGTGFDPRNVPHAAQEEDPTQHLEVRLDLGLREGGFGIMLARGLVDEFRYNELGNEVTLVKRFEANRP